MSCLAVRKVTIEPHPDGCLVGMDEDGQMYEWGTPAEAVAAIRARDALALKRKGTSTATVVEWRDMPADFTLPE